jgi:predicted nicotinamide N-methyase
MNPPESSLPAGYSVVLREHRLGSCSVKLYEVADTNALSDTIDPNAFEEDERFPYWAELWPSGIALATFVLGRGLGASVEAVELGCGLGLTGVAAALAGARVTFTDFDCEALAFARANHALNLGSPGRIRLVDWRAPPPDLEAPLVLAADVLYERRFLEPFVETLRRTIAPEGVAYVAEPGRDIARGTVERLEAEGFERELHLEEVEVRGRTQAVWIHELRRQRRHTKDPFSA